MVKIYDICNAAEEGDKQLQDILKTAGDLNQVKDSDGNTALHQAAWYGHLQAAKHLINHNANVNQENNDRDTPLHFAAYCGKSEVIKLLLENGGNANAANKDKNTPLRLVIIMGHLNCVQVLVDFCKDKETCVNAVNNSNETALHIAAYHGMPEVLKLFLENGGNANAANKDKDTALHLVTRKYSISNSISNRKDYLSCVQVLVDFCKEKKTCVNAVNNSN